MINTRELNWSWQGQDIVLGLDEAGRGPVVLLLPALSSISTRGEMHPLMERLASRFHTLTIDWPGFGTRSRPEVTWTPNALSSFLDRTVLWPRGTLRPTFSITPHIALGRSREQL